VTSTPLPESRAAARASNDRLRPQALAPAASEVVRVRFAGGL
jgi:hypothetical protein